MPLYRSLLVVPEGALEIDEVASWTIRAQALPAVTPSRAIRYAATPATCGAAMEVPDRDFEPPPGYAAVILCPGA